MYIEELILEGFKSYATRTVISGWDSEFNAITGLNGTGKSNILDAICFVLGIDNLRQVRATTLQDLVYKRGQAGITKASVTLVFNNKDVAKSPIGFAEHPNITVTRQIVIGGKNKYLINGHLSQQKAVDNLFQSVQLNINNPHFLIMQGQITKVLNMKPPEILAMIEETAGTRMYEDRKVKALATMDKKERKVEEITKLLGEVIGPKLDVLRAERNEFIEYRRLEADVDHLRHFVVAQEYFLKKEMIVACEDDLEKTREQHVQLTSEEAESMVELEQIRSRADTLTKKRDGELKNNNKLTLLEKAVKEAANNLARLSTQIELMKQNQSEEQNRVSSNLKKQAQELSLLKQLEEEHSKAVEKLGTAQINYDEVAAKAKQSDELLRSLTTGVSNSNDHVSGYSKLLNEYRDKTSAAEQEAEKAAMKLRHIEAELKSLEPQTAKAKKEAGELAGKMEHLQRETLQLEDSIVKYGDCTEDPACLSSRVHELVEQIHHTKEKMTILQGKVNSLQFKYSDPEPGFDRSKVKGIIAELISIPPQYIDHTTALEVTAGGKLYNVVVESEKVANLLLEKGNLIKRVTIIPLNKIIPKSIPADKIKLANSIAPGKVNVALSLVGYDQDISTAMEYVFGSTFICKDKEAANLITFDKRISCKAVTLDGDIYDPSGVLTGGSPTRSALILESLNQYKDLQKELEGLEAQLADTNGQLNTIKLAISEKAEFERQLDLKKHELTLVHNQFESNSSGKILIQVKKLQLEVSAFKEQIKSAKTRQKEAELECRRIEVEMHEFSGDRDGKLKTLEKEHLNSKAKLNKEAKALAKIKQAAEMLEADVARQGSELVSTEGTISEARHLVKQFAVDIEAMQSELAEVKAAHLLASQQLEIEKQYMLAFSQELELLEAKKSQLEDTIEKLAIEKKRLSNTIQKLTSQKQEAQTSSKQILHQNSWIKDREREFNVQGGAFDFASCEIEQIRKRLYEMEGAICRIRKTINANVMDMIDRVESKEQSLKQMLATVKKDKAKIEDTIVKLDDFERQALERTWHKVNADFGAIFGELLPGNTCKLEPLEGEDLSKGLEVKVCLGAVWKQSLVELSGGQRSVIALSLILALLQYKPAPMYILDEVDAALDLSHTQNIGQLLRTRFKGSQFIVVSLKDGMFNNANVLFRTRFRDGISSTERITNMAVDNPLKGQSAKAIKAATVYPKATAIIV